MRERERERERERIGTVENHWTNRLKIGWKTEKCPEDFQWFVVTKIPVKTHELKLY